MKALLDGMTNYRERQHRIDRNIVLCKFCVLLILIGLAYSCAVRPLHAQSDKDDVILAELLAAQARKLAVQAVQP